MLGRKPSEGTAVEHPNSGRKAEIVGRCIVVQKSGGVGLYDALRLCHRTGRVEDHAVIVGVRNGWYIRPMTARSDLAKEAVAAVRLPRAELDAAPAA